MKEIDRKICDVVKKHECVYTRYADDILISSKQPISDEEYKEIDQAIKLIVSQSGLATNEKKNQFINFDESHSFFRYIGVNIIHHESGNYVSVGKKYINNVAKDYIVYDKKRKVYDDSSQLSDDLFYTRLKIIGKIAFIKQIEGEVGMERLKQRLYKYDPNVVLDAV